MVYSGRPSTGCRTCRQRRVKCDEARPTCNQCKRARHECTGYPDAQDLRLQHETTSIIKRTRRIHSAHERKSLSPASSGDGAEGSSMDHVLLVNPSPSVDSIALNFYLSAMVIDPVSHGRYVGHFELLPRLYLQESTDSALAKVTDACCLASLSMFGNQDSPVQKRAYEAYGNAVVALRLAMQNVEQRSRNETLIATLLMLVVECVLARDQSPQQQWKHHVMGAVALLRSRGGEVFKDPVATRLWKAVSKSMERGARLRGEDVPPFFAPRLVGEQGKLMPEQQLGQVIMDVGVMRRDVLAALQDHDLFTILELVEHSKEADKRLVEWTKGLPDSYLYKVVDSKPRKTNLEAGESFEMPWGETRYDYPDAHNHRLWNGWRVTRIWANSFTYRLLTSLPSGHGFTHDIAASMQNLQEMADGICASLPSQLSGSLKSASESPRLDQAVTAYYALWPLYVARGIPMLPGEQRQWIRERLVTISETFQIRHGVRLAARGDNIGPFDGGKPLWVEIWDESGIETAWENAFLYGCGAF